MTRHFLVLAFFPAVLAGLSAQTVDQAPILTVCEVLNNLDNYRGKNIILVGASNSTFEGTFLSEHCVAGDTVLIRGQRWQRTVYLSPPGASKSTVLPENIQAALKGKRDRLMTTEQVTPRPPTHTLSNLFSTYIVAVFGELDCPAHLRAPSRGRPGNGYGANGSVPARIIPVTIQVLDR